MKLRQGATFNRVFTWAIDGEPVNLSGYTARSQIRKTAASDEVALTLTSYITLGGAQGTVTLAIPATITAGLAAGKYVFDLELVSGSTVTTLLAGPVEVAAEVTR